MINQTSDSHRIPGRGSKINHSETTNGYDSIETSQISITGRKGQSEQEHGIGHYVKSIIFGGIDGVLISLSIIAGASGADFGWNVVIGMGLSCVLANALHLGIGEFLSSKAHRDFVNTEKRREQWEFKNFKEGEVMEMINIFEDRGMSRADAELVVRKMSEYDSFFINMMITEELGLQLPDEDDAALIKDSIVMFTSFAVCGCLPLVVYLASPWRLLNSEDLLGVALLVAGLVLFALGAAKSSFSSTFWLVGGIEVIAIGAACAGASYGVGYAVQWLLGQVVPDS